VQTGDVQKAARILERFEYQLTELGTSYSKSFPAGTIFVTIAAVIGATAISDREVFATDSVVGIVPSKEMDVAYLELFLRQKRQFLENRAATQTAQKNINLQVLRPLLVPCPPRSVQELIAGEILASLKAAKDAQIHVEKIRALLGSFINRIVGVTA
jgi:type I restriction enzyme S subunit